MEKEEYAFCARNRQNGLYLGIPKGKVKCLFYAAETIFGQKPQFWVSLSQAGVSSGGFYPDQRHFQCKGLHAVPCIFAVINTGNLDPLRS